MGFAAPPGAARIALATIAAKTVPSVSFFFISSPLYEGVRVSPGTFPPRAVAVNPSGAATQRAWRRGQGLIFQADLPVYQNSCERGACNRVIRLGLTEHDQASQNERIVSHLHRR